VPALKIQKTDEHNMILLYLHHHRAHHQIRAYVAQADAVLKQFRFRWAQLAGALVPVVAKNFGGFKGKRRPTSSAACRPSLLVSVIPR